MEKAAAASARLRTTLLMNLASVVEKADEQVLPAVYYFIGRSLNATPAQLGTLTLCRALVQVCHESCKAYADVWQCNYLQ